MTPPTMVMSVSPSALRPKVFIRVVRADGGPEAVVPMRGDTLSAGRAADVALPDDPFVAAQQIQRIIDDELVARGIRFPQGGLEHGLLD